MSETGAVQPPGQVSPRPRWARPFRRPHGRAAIALAAGTVLLATLAAVSLASGTKGSGSRALPLAKDFTLPALAHPRQRVTLAAYVGRPVIVNFFASWCVPCKKETPLLARFYRGEHEQVTILGIDSNDSASAARRFVRAAGVAYPVGFDPRAATAAAYGVVAIPQTFFLNAAHRVVKRVFGAVTLAELRTGIARSRS